MCFPADREIPTFSKAAPRVKPMKWELMENTRDITMVAYTAVGNYCISRRGDDYFSTHNSKVISKTDSLHSAQADAEEHYTKTVRSLIES